jgi:hypothetical protein
MFGHSFGVSSRCRYRKQLTVCCGFQDFSQQAVIMSLNISRLQLLLERSVFCQVENVFLLFRWTFRAFLMFLFLQANADVVPRFQVVLELP